jgi:hypothetical protein
MNNIKNIEEIKTLLKEKNYNEEKINKVIDFITPFYEFYDFMLKEHNMNFDDVEKDSSKFSEKIFPEYLEKMNESDSKLKFLTEISGDIMKKYAIKYNYLEAEKVKRALTTYIEIIMINKLKK